MRRRCEKLPSMIRSLSLLLAALAVTCARVPPPLPPAPPGVFTVATWNVEHLVDEYDNPYVQRDQDQEKSPAQLAEIAETIRAIDADIFAFQEIEGSDVLRAFAEEHLADMGYTHFVSCPDDNWHQNVAVMSRFPLGPLTSMTAVVTPVPGFDGGGTALINDRLLAVEVYPDESCPMLVVTVHLKAGWGERNQHWRTGQIELLRDWLEDQMTLDPALNVCVLGDFNCAPDSPEMQRLTTPENGTAYRNVSGADGPGSTHRVGRSIDHILANDNLTVDYVEDSLRVWPTSTHGPGRPSDHRPVTSRFRACDP